MRIPLIKPFVSDETRARVLEVLDSGQLTEGAVTRELEAAFRAFIRCRHAIAVTSCTTGLELALRCLGIGPGDEVIVPDYTYPATASVVAIVGATAVIVDVAPESMLIDYDAVESAITPRTKAVIPVSLFGNPLDYSRLSRIKARHGVAIVEDAACAVGAEYDGRMTGDLADISVFSLHPRKFITTGEGGIVTTNVDEWAVWMESYKHFGMAASADRQSVVFERVGTNFKLSNIQAAVGVVQMGAVATLLQRRRLLASRYEALFSGEPRIQIPTTTAKGVHSQQSFCVLVEERDRILQELRRSGIEAQIGTYSLHHHPAFQSGRFRQLPPLVGSDTAFARCLALPLFHDMCEADQQEVVASLRRAL